MSSYLENYQSVAVYFCIMISFDYVIKSRFFLRLGTSVQSEKFDRERRNNNCEKKQPKFNWDD
jgi:hypothetical protein